jgi:peptidoglycan/xylan/chitin deacetylase (PgdA/CDA1 family)
VPAETRAHALTELRGEDEAVCAWAGSRALPPASVPENARSATEAELAQALTGKGVSVAVHTWSHPNLAALDTPRLQGELERPLQWLLARWPGTLPVVSYPYGLTSPGVIAAASRAGLHAGFLVSGGRLSSARERVRYLLPRLNVPAGISEAGFELRTAGLVRS